MVGDDKAALIPAEGACDFPTKRYVLKIVGEDAGQCLKAAQVAAGAKTIRVDGVAAVTRSTASSVRVAEARSYSSGPRQVSSRSVHCGPVPVIGTLPR